MKQNDFNSFPFKQHYHHSKNNDCFINNTQNESIKNIRSQRVQKLKDILNKNLQVKNFFIKRKIINILQSKSENSQQNQHETILQMVKINEQHKVYRNQVNSESKKPGCKYFSVQNPQYFPQSFNNSQFKLKIRILSLRNHDKSEPFLMKQRSKKKLNNSTIEQKSLEKVNQSQLLKMKKQNQQRRRKNRNIKSLKLTKIQHLPQIIFTQNPNCSQKKFSKPSMADIDHNILVNEIQKIERTTMIELKQREKNEKLLKAKIRNYQQKRISYHSIGT